jgi:hypothetical protein
MEDDADVIVRPPLGLALEAIVDDDLTPSRIDAVMVAWIKLDEREKANFLHYFRPG